MEESADYPAHEVKYRDPMIVAVLSLVTFSIYWFYLIYVWSKDLNCLLGKEKYSPGVMLFLTVVTCGLVGVVVECLVAADLADPVAKTHGVEPNKDLLAWVIALNVSAFLVAFFVPILGVVISIPLGIAATIMVQLELNKYAHLEPAY